MVWGVEGGSGGVRVGVVWSGCGGVQLVGGRQGGGAGGVWWEGWGGCRGQGVECVQ